jgi:predicted ATPase
VLLGKALQTGRQLPYQPLIDVLRRRLEQERGLEGHLSPVWLAELTRLLPELRERYPDLPVPATDEAFGHNRLFEASARLIRRWAARRPLVLLLDDMQWADTATLDLLLYLTRSLAEQPAPILLLFNLSTGPGGGTDAQSSWLLALKRTCLPLTELLLTPFTKEEASRFVQELAWAEQPAEMDGTGSTGAFPSRGEAPESQQAVLSFSDWLYRHTSGQPLYLLETLNELLARGILFPALQESGVWGLVLRSQMLAHAPEGELIPPALRELIRSQLARLSPSAWTLLVMASMLEAGLSFERLCQVAGLEELEGLRALEELLHGGWLSEATALAGSPVCDGYAFSRELIREVVYQEAGATRRRVVQRHLAALIRAGIADDQGEEARAPLLRPLASPFAQDTGGPYTLHLSRSATSVV